jgi:hypothetical protein
MSELTVVEFESKTFGNSYVSELSDGPPFTVHGVALGAGDVTVGQSGIKKKWPATELEGAADSLRGTNLVVDHENEATGVVGRVTKSGYKEETGVVYEAELFDEELAEKIKNGLLEVSIRGFHADVDSLEEDEETEAKIVEDIQFDNLSIVPTGAAPSNTLQMGEHAELSAAELSAFTDSLEAAQLQEIEPGMWVQSDGTKGITISQVQDGEIEVDIYEESDGKWRSTGETEMFDTGSLDEWDVDEEEDIGAREDEEEDESDNEEAALEFTQDDWVKGESSGGMWYGRVKKTKTSGQFDDEIDGDVTVEATEDNPAALIEIYQGSEASGEMVAHRFESINEWDGPDEEENAAASQGDFVKWKGPSDEPMHGQIVEINQDGEQFMATIRCFSESGDKLDMTKEKPLQALDKWDRMNEESPDDMRDDSSGGIQAPTWEDGQMVKWQVNPEMKGKIVHVDRDKKVLMVEVMEASEQGLQPTGYTLTAGYQDVVPMDREMAATTTRDVPTQDAEPTHDTDSVNNLLKRFIEEQGESKPSLADFVDWMQEENLAIERGEGEEEILDSQKDLDNSHEGEPHRYIDAEDESSELEARYDDYPEAASENAQMALDAREETDNPNDCGTDVGWKRANQLANGEGLTREQIGKMSAFNRHRQNSEMDDEEGKSDCGWMMWKAWGGDEGVDWAQRKLDSIEEENAMKDVPEDHMFSSREDAQEKADELDLNGVHEMDGKWMPGETHEEYMDNVASTSKHGDDYSDEEEDDEEMAPPEEFQFETEEDALDFIEDKDGLTGVHEMDGFWMPGDDHDEFAEWHEMKHSEDMTSADEGKSESDVSDVEELQEYDFHEVSWDGTTEKDWSTPNLEDFPQMDGNSNWEDLSESDKEDIGMHFLISSSGFPAEEFGDMKLPVVEPNGDLNVNALAAVKGGRGTSAVEGLSDEMGEQIDEYVNSLANDPDLFDRNWGEEEASAHSIGGTSGRPTASKSVGGVRVLSGDDLQQRNKSGESDADSPITYKVNIMTENIEEKLSELDEPVAVEAEEVEELRNKADRFEEMSENLEALRERTDILDEVDRSQVEELAESDDPVVKESARYDELQSEAEQVAGVYAAQLAEEYPAFSAEELTDKFSIEELREKYEEEIGDVEDLASSDDAEPRSQDADEESLEDAADEDSEESSEEELSENAADKQAELKNKILGGR